MACLTAMGVVLVFGLMGCSAASDSSSNEATVKISMGNPPNAVEGEEVGGDEKDIEIIEAPLYFNAENGQAIYTVLLKNNSENVAGQVVLSPVAKSESGDLVGGSSVGHDYVNYVGPGETTAVSVELVGCDSEPVSVDWNVKVPYWYKPNDANTYKPEIGATCVKPDAFNETRAQAEVINTGEVDFSAVFLVAVYRDSAGNIIGSGSGSEFAIDAGTSKVIKTGGPREALNVASTDFYVSWQL